jgi:hypothetical protein
MLNPSNNDIFIYMGLISFGMINNTMKSPIYENNNMPSSETFIGIKDDTNILSNTFSKEDNKEKIVNQICYLLDLHHDQLNANKEKFEKVYYEKISIIVNNRNKILSITTFIIPLLFTIASTGIFKEFLGLYLATSISSVAAVGLVVYLRFTIHQRKTSSKFLNIQKAFHDGYTTVNFMKGFIHNPFYIDQLNEDQLYSLNQYYAIIQGGIVKRIRKKIEENVDKNISEKDIYGNSEKELYTGLINEAYLLYKNNDNKEDKVLGYFKDPKPCDLFAIFNKYYVNDLEYEVEKEEICFVV